jgi:hypothetical protein
MEKNNGDEKNITQWIFMPGMLFNSMEKWWGDLGRRTIPHEGLDLCFYKDLHGRIHGLDVQTRIPAMFDGRIVKIMKDYLGMTMIMEHDPIDENSPGFLTIYGHSKPMKEMVPGRRVKKGDIVCSISWRQNSKSHGLLPHLHLTMGLFSSELSLESLDWSIIPKTHLLTLMDPLPLLDWPFEIRESQESN